MAPLVEGDREGGHPAHGGDVPDFGSALQDIVFAGHSLEDIFQKRQVALYPGGLQLPYQGWTSEQFFYWSERAASWQARMITMAVESVSIGVGSLFDGQKTKNATDRLRHVGWSKNALQS